MRATGFTLIELAVVLVVLSFMLGGLLVPLGTQVEARRTRATEEQLAAVKDALVGFAIANGNRLPCPDLDGDGVEDRPGTPPALCPGVEGGLPWVTLGVGREDAWGRPFRYRANDAFSALGGAPNPPDTTGTLKVRDRSGSTALTVGNPHAPVAIIFSCGKNGVPDAGNHAGASPAGAAGCTNPAAPDGVYVQGVPTAGAFDDVLVWLSKNTLLHRLVSAGTWP